MLDTLEEEVEKGRRHLEILNVVLEEEPIGIMQLSNETGHPHHKVRYSLRTLEDDDLITPTASGAETTENVDAFLEAVDDRCASIQERLDSLRFDEVPDTD